MSTYPYRFVWKNTPGRQTLYNCLCRVLVRGAMNSCLIETEDGQKAVVSRNALRKVKAA
jgi:hypothetical protein